MAAQHDRLPTPVGRCVVVGVDSSTMSLARVELVAALPLSTRDPVVVAAAAERPFGLPCDIRTDVRLGHPVEMPRRLVAEQQADLLAPRPHGTVLVVASPRLGTRRAGRSEAPSSRMTRGEEVPQ